MRLRAYELTPSPYAFLLMEIWSSVIRINLHRLLDVQLAKWIVREGTTRPREEGCELTATDSAGFLDVTTRCAPRWSASTSAFTSHHNNSFGLAKRAAGWACSWGWARTRAALWCPRPPGIRTSAGPTGTSGQHLGAARSDVSFPLCGSDTHLILFRRFSLVSRRGFEKLYIDKTRKARVRFILQNEPGSRRGEEGPSDFSSSSSHADGFYRLPGSTGGQRKDC